MNAPRQEKHAYVPSVPRVLLWQDPAGRFSLELPSRVLTEWLEFFTALNGSGVGLLTATKRPRSIRGGEGFVLGFQTVPNSTDLVGLIRARRDEANDRFSIVGVAADQSARGFQFHDREEFRQVMLEISEPRLFLSVQRQDGAISATLFSWSAESNQSQPVGVAFPLDLAKLEEQYYAPFTPVFFEQSDSVPTPQPAPTPPPRGNSLSQRTSSADATELVRMIVSQAEPTAAVDERFSVQVSPAPRQIPEKSDQRAMFVKGTALVLVLLAGVVGAFNLLVRTNTQTTPSAEPAPDAVAKGTTPDVGLSVILKGTLMEIRWDPNSSAARSSQSGRVEIRDGAEKVWVVLSPAELATGRILYSPRSADTSIHLQMTTPEGVTEDTVRVIQARSIERADGQTREDRSRSVSASPGDAAAISEGALTAGSGPISDRRQPSPGKFFVPPAQKSVLPQAAVMDAPQFTFASSDPAQLSLPKLDVRVPPRFREAPPLSSVTPPVPLSDLSLYVPPDLRTVDMLGKTISVMLQIDAKGRVARVEGPTLSPRLAALVGQTARRWRFKPATTRGTPVPSEMTIHLKFPSQN